MSTDSLSSSRLIASCVVDSSRENDSVVALMLSSRRSDNSISFIIASGISVTASKKSSETFCVIFSKKSRS